MSQCSPYRGHMNRDKSYHGKTWVYVFKQHSTVLYVGMTCQPKQRLDSHKRKPWYEEASDVTWHQLETRQEAKEQERILIELTHPKYNKTHKPQKEAA